MNISEILGQFIGGVKTLNVGRLEDLPYMSSPPIQFVYESTTSLLLGAYQWSDIPSPLTPNRPLLHNATYFFRNITLTADVEELDFTTNIVTTPEFQTYLQSTARTQQYREAILMPKFLQQFEFRFLWQTPMENDQLFATFKGILNQGAGLIGKTSITLKAIISAQEIVDDNFTKLLKKKYPII